MLKTYYVPGGLHRSLVQITTTQEGRQSWPRFTRVGKLRLKKAKEIN